MGREAFFTSLPGCGMDSLPPPSPRNAGQGGRAAGRSTNSTDREGGGRDTDHSGSTNSGDGISPPPFCFALMVTSSMITISGKTRGRSTATKQGPVPVVSWLFDGDCFWGVLLFPTSATILPVWVGSSLRRGLFRVTTFGIPQRSLFFSRVVRCANLYYVSRSCV